MRKDGDDLERRALEAFAPAGEGRRVLHRDKGGALWEAERIGAAAVRIFPQGGGFAKRGTLEAFLRDFERVETAWEDWKPATVEAEFIPEGESLPCHTTGRLWNGWGMPAFEYETALRLCSLMPDLRHDPADDSFVWTPDGCAEDEERHKPREIVSGGKTVKVWGIGAGSWIWEDPVPVVEAQLKNKNEQSRGR